MSYEKKLSCITKRCQNQLTVPIKVVVKGKVVVDVARCPKCHRSYKYLLPLDQKDQWMPWVTPGFFLCDVCGMSNADNWKYSGAAGAPSVNRIRIVMHCKNCRAARAKVASAQLWTDITKALEKTPEAPPVAKLICPHCAAEIPLNSKVCPKCSATIVCKCGAPFIPDAQFCNQCGHPVEKIEAKVTPEPSQEGVCPTCQEKFEQGSAFCSVCGQELFCDKCGAPIREGALFCCNCGDPVRKGKLSE